MKPKSATEKSLLCDLNSKIGDSFWAGATSRFIFEAFGINNYVFYDPGLLESRMSQGC